MKTKVEKFLNSNYFIFAICAILFLNWFFETIVISYIALCICGCLAFLTCTSLSPVALLLCLAPCCKNEGFKFSSTIIYILIPFAIMLVACFVYYIVKNFIIPKKKINPGSLRLGLALAFIACFFGGAFSPDFSASHMFAATGIVVLSYFIYVVMLNTTGPEFKDYIYKILIAICCLSFLETAILFLKTAPDARFMIIINKQLRLGWLMNNSAATIYSITLPLCLYQAHNSKRAYLHYSFFFIICIMLILTLSRTSLLFVAIIIPLITIYAFIKTPSKKQMIIVFSIGCLILLVLYFIFKKEILLIVEILKVRGSGLNGRKPIWDYCIAEFKKYPAFGIGFFGEDMSGLGYPARLLHNTPLQILCCTGIIGTVLFIPFFYQRYKLLIGKISLYKVFALASVLLWEFGGFFDLNIIRVLQIMIINCLLASCENEQSPQSARLTFHKNRSIMNK